MKGRRRIFGSIDQVAQFPNSMGTVRAPCHWHAKKYLALKAIRLKEGIFDVQAPLPPLLKSTQGKKLKMWGAEAGAPRGSTKLFFRSGSWYPLATKRAFTSFLPSAIFQLSTQRVSTVA